VTVPGAEPIVTARLRLDPLRVADAEEMQGVLADPALHVFTGGGPPTVEELRERYRHQARGSSSDGEEAWLNWVAREADDGSAVGFVQATVTGEGTAADLAWVIGVPWQGLGYATEAALGMADWLRRHGVGSLSARVHPDNVASERVAAALGLEATGEIEDGERVWRGVGDQRGRWASVAGRGGAAWRSLGVGVALVGFALFETTMARVGELPGGPDQWLRDLLLGAAGIILAIAGVRRIRRTGARGSPR
jgi:RimJ/RimL family protein N-acetyltransferase